MADGAIADRAMGGSTMVIDLAVRGMHCASCVALIEEALTGDPGVDGATVDLAGGRASVVFHPDAVSVDGLCAVVVGAGDAAAPAAPPRPAP